LKSSKPPEHCLRRRRKMSKESIGLLNEQGVSIPLTGVEVRGSITGHSARVKIHQSFSNIESKALEVVYKFPLPAGSSICGFKATIGEKIIQGEIEEGQRALNCLMAHYPAVTEPFSWMRNAPNIFYLVSGKHQPGRFCYCRN